MRTRMGVLAVASVGCLAACGGSDDTEKQRADSPRGEIVITCEACPTKPTDDPFQRYRKELTDAFNAKYRGRYRIQPKPYTPADDADSAQHYERAAATGTLPDLFTDQATVIRSVARSGKLIDFADALGEDGWKDTFQPDVFASLTDDADHVWGVPEQRDAIGIYYNKALFKKAGMTEFPATWDGLAAACGPLKSAGAIPFAMDGDWVTQLMWANYLGTQPGGAEFLRSDIRKGDYASNASVVKATEWLKDFHTSGAPDPVHRTLGW